MTACQNQTSNSQSAQPSLKQSLTQAYSPRLTPPRGEDIHQGPTHLGNTVGGSICQPSPFNE